MRKLSALFLLLTLAVLGTTLARAANPVTESTTSPDAQATKTADAAFAMAAKEVNVIVRVSGDAHFSKHLLIGPVTAFITGPGMNPFIYSIQKKYDNVSLSQPTYTLSGGSTTFPTAMPYPSAPVAANLPAPPPGVLPRHNGPVDTYAPIADDVCYQTPYATVDQFNTCRERIVVKEVTNLINEIDRDEKKLDDAASAYDTMSSAAPKLWDAPITNAEDIILFRKNVKSLILAFIPAFLQAAVSVPEWPSSHVAAVQSSLNKFKLLLMNCSNQSKANTCISPQENGKKDNKPPTQPAAAPNVINDAIARVNTALSTLSADSDTGATATSYIADRKLTLSQIPVVASMSQDSFSVVSSEPCVGLFGGERQHTFSLQTNSGGDALQIVCPGKIYTTAGVAFSAVGTHTYTVVAPPSTPPSPVAATVTASHQRTASADTTATPAPSVGIVADTASGSWKPIFLTLANFQLSDNPYVPVASVGVGVSSTNSDPLNLDYFAGLSEPLYRSILVTYGAHYGKQEILPPGYSVGQTIYAPNGFQLPPAYRYVFKPFISITIGGDRKN